MVLFLPYQKIFLLGSTGRRHRSLVGQESVQEAYNFSRVERRKSSLLGAVESGEISPMTYDQVQAIKDPFYCDYVCQDGRQIHVVMLGNIYHQERICKALGILDEAKKLDIPHPNIYEEYAYGWGTSFVPEYIEPIKEGFPNSKFLTAVSRLLMDFFNNIGVLC